MRANRLLCISPTEVFTQDPALGSRVTNSYSVGADADIDGITIGPGMQQGTAATASCATGAVMCPLAVGPGTGPSRLGKSVLRPRTRAGQAQEVKYFYVMLRCAGPDDFQLLVRGDKTSKRFSPVKCVISTQISNAPQHYRQSHSNACDVWQCVMLWYPAGSAASSGHNC